METLALQLSELLGVTIDKAIELYPVLRSQYIWYDIFTNFKFTVGVLNIFSITMGIIFGIIMLFNVDFEGEVKPYMWKLIRYTLIVIAILSISTIILTILIPVLAPDIVFIQGIKGGL